MTEVQQPPPQNGIDLSAAEEDDSNKSRPADIEQDMREMERRKRVEAIMGSKLFREELERIVDSARDGGTCGILQQLSDIVGLPASRVGSVYKASNCLMPINDIRGVESMGYAKGEKILRCKLAATFRLLDLYGWTQGLGAQITARLKVDQEYFLVNPYGLLYHEITASSLNKVDMQGNIVEQGTTNFGVNKSHFSLHSVVHAARPDIRCAIYIGCSPVVAISSLKTGLLPITKDACVLGEVTSHQYSGALDNEERDRLIRNLGPNSKVMLLTNHGALCCGETIEEAFYAACHIVQACETQLKLLPVGLENLTLIPEESRKTIYEQSRRPPEDLEKKFAAVSTSEGANVTSEDTDATPKVGAAPKWRVGGAEFEALMRMLDNAGYRTGYIYRHPLIKSEPPKPKNDVELPPAVSSLGYLLEEEELFKQGIWKKGDLRKGGDRSRWLNSPNVYQKVEVLETGTPDPKKITKWVAEGSPTHSTPVRIEDPLQFVPAGTNPKEFKRLQQQIKDNRRADKISAGPQSHILEGVTWDEANRIRDATVSSTGEHVVLVGAASKGIIQRGFQHNATVYKAPYAKNPFDNVTDDELNEYKRTVERKKKSIHGEYTDTDFSESEALSSLPPTAQGKHGKHAGATQSEPEDMGAHQVMRIETQQAPVPSQPEVVLSDATLSFINGERTHTAVNRKPPTGRALKNLEIQIPVDDNVPLNIPQHELQEQSHQNPTLLSSLYFQQAHSKGEVLKKFKEATINDFRSKENNIPEDVAKGPLWFSPFKLKENNVVSNEKLRQNNLDICIENRCSFVSENRKNRKVEPLPNSDSSDQYSKYHTQCLTPPNSLGRQLSLNEGVSLSTVFNDHLSMYMAMQLDRDKLVYNRKLQYNTDTLNGNLFCYPTTPTPPYTMMSSNVSSNYDAPYDLTFGSSTANDDTHSCIYESLYKPSGACKTPQICGKVFESLLSLVLFEKNGSKMEKSTKKPQFIINDRRRNVRNAYRSNIDPYRTVSHFGFNSPKCVVRPEHKHIPSNCLNNLGKMYVPFRKALSYEEIFSSPRYKDLCETCFDKILRLKPAWLDINGRKVETNISTMSGQNSSLDNHHLQRESYAAIDSYGAYDNSSPLPLYDYVDKDFVLSKFSPRQLEPLVEVDETTSDKRTTLTDSVSTSSPLESPFLERIMRMNFSEESTNAEFKVETIANDLNPSDLDECKTHCADSKTMDVTLRKIDSQNDLAETMADLQISNDQEIDCISRCSSGDSKSNDLVVPYTYPGIYITEVIDFGDWQESNQNGDYPALQDFCDKNTESCDAVKANNTEILQSKDESDDLLCHNMESTELQPQLFETSTVENVSKNSTLTMENFSANIELNTSFQDASLHHTYSVNPFEGLVFSTTTKPMNSALEGISKPAIRNSPSVKSVTWRNDCDNANGIEEEEKISLSSPEKEVFYGRSVIVQYISPEKSKQFSERNNKHFHNHFAKNRSNFNMKKSVNEGENSTTSLLNLRKAWELEASYESFHYESLKNVRHGANNSMDCSDNPNQNSDNDDIDMCDNELDDIEREVITKINENKLKETEGGEIFGRIEKAIRNKVTPKKLGEWLQKKRDQEEYKSTKPLNGEKTVNTEKKASIVDHSKRSENNSNRSNQHISNKRQYKKRKNIKISGNPHPSCSQFGKKTNVLNGVRASEEAPGNLAKDSCQRNFIHENIRNASKMNTTKKTVMNSTNSPASSQSGVPCLKSNKKISASPTETETYTFQPKITHAATRLLINLPNQTSEDASPKSTSSKKRKKSDKRQPKFKRSNLKKEKIECKDANEDVAKTTSLLDLKKQGPSKVDIEIEALGNQILQMEPQIESIKRKHDQYSEQVAICSRTLDECIELQSNCIKKKYMFTRPVETYSISEADD